MILIKNKITKSHNNNNIINNNNKKIITKTTIMTAMMMMRTAFLITVKKDLKTLILTISIAHFHEAELNYIAQTLVSIIINNKKCYLIFQFKKIKATSIISYIIISS